MAGVCRQCKGQTTNTRAASATGLCFGCERTTTMEHVLGRTKEIAMNSFKVVRKLNTIYASSLKAGQIGIIAKGIHAGIHAGLPVMRTSTADFFILTTGGTRLPC